MNVRRLLILSVILTGIGTGCTSDTSLAPAAAVAPAALSSASVSLARGPGGLVSDGLATINGVANGLLSCKPLKAESRTEAVGPRGGTIKVGPHTLTIPAGALTSTVQITASIVPDSVSSVIFKPEGLRFNPAVRPVLSLGYYQCAHLGPLAPPKSIVYTTDALAINAVMASHDNPLQYVVTAPLDHFSRYAVAW
jgi:hypothetical protein